MTREHPDELTPRERDVLELLRLGLTNEEIADRLGISLDGAKYHVSQILSKLGVTTREEAVAHEHAQERVAEAFQPPRRRWWAALPLAAKAAGVAVILATVGGLGVLAWGVLRTDEDADPAASGAAAENLLPDMVLQPEDVPSNMKRRDNEDAGLGFQTRSELGEKVSYGVEYELDPDEVSPGEIACIQSSVALFSGEEDASRGLAKMSANLRTEGGDLWHELGLPGIGEEGTAFEAVSSEAVFCGSYEDVTADVVLMAFRMSNTISVMGIVFLESGADPAESVQYAQKQLRRIGAVLDVGPLIGDHWHAPYSFTACGEKQPNAPVWESGIHTHGDGILHIHPFQAFEEGPGASLVKWFEYGGGLLTETEIMIPGFRKAYRNGDLCPDGEPGELQVFVTRLDKASEQRLEGDALPQYIPHDGDRIRIVFGPPDESQVYEDRTVIPPEQATRIIEMDVTDDGTEDSVRFVPDRIEVQAGETAKIVVRNTGTLSHVLRVIGEDGQYATGDDFVSVPDIILPGEEGFVVVRMTHVGEVPFGDDTLALVVEGVITVLDSEASGITPALTPPVGAGTPPAP